MITKDFKITNEMGIHMRPANILVSAMSKYKSNITIVFGDKEINAKSIMHVMAACIKCGAEITVKCDGADENEMMAEFSNLVETGFGE